MKEYTIRFRATAEEKAAIEAAALAAGMSMSEWMRMRLVVEEEPEPRRPEAKQDRLEIEENQ